MIILNFLLAVLGLLSFVVEGKWTVDCHNVVRERIDPVTSPGKVSGHVNRVVGGSALNFTMDNPKLNLNTGCSSCSVTQDFSNYWVPQLYFSQIDADYKSTFYITPDVGAKIVYTQLRNSTEEHISAFPPGLTIAVGSHLRRDYLDDAMAKAITFQCGGQPDSSASHELQLNCTSSVVAKVHFPSCWNGKDLSSEQMAAHMAYPDGGYNWGRCPDTHPVRVIGLSYEFEFNTTDPGVPNNIPAKPPIVTSFGDVTGMGFYGVFVNGWDEDILQKAIDTCNNTTTGDIASTCSVLKVRPVEERENCKVPLRVDESISDIHRLPGCNPVGGPVDPSACGFDPQPITDFELFYQDLTSHKWAYAGCSPSVDPLNLHSHNLSATGSWNESDTTPEKCLIMCMDILHPSQAHPAWFSITNNTCACALQDPLPGTVPTSWLLGNCDVPCSGNSSFHCGGKNSSSLYKYCPPGTNCTNYHFSPKNIIPMKGPGHQKRTQVNDDVEVTPSSVIPGVRNVTRERIAHAVQTVRAESPDDSSLFIGYKVCARAYDGEADNNNNSPPSVENVSCYVFEGSRAEAVAAAFIDWAANKYELNEAGVFVSPEDTIDARIAMRLTALQDLRPRSMAVDFVFSVILLSCVALIGIGVVTLQVQKWKLKHAQQKQLEMQTDAQVIQHIAELSPASRDQLFAKYEDARRKAAVEEENKTLYAIPQGIPC